MTEVLQVSGHVQLWDSSVVLEQQAVTCVLTSLPPALN